MKASLQGLSEELILEIFDQLLSLCFHSSRKHSARNFLNLCRCCRQFYRLGLPMAYFSFFEFDRGGTHSNIARFLCKILEVPSLGGYVKYVTINAEDIHDDMILLDITQVASWDPENLSRLRSAVDEAAQSPQDALDWYRSIEEGSWDAWATLLLSRLPNLEVLHTTQFGNLMDKDDRPWLLKFLNHAAELQQQSSKSTLALPNLTEVSMYQEGEDGGIRTSEATALLQLDSVKTFSASNYWLHDDVLYWSGVRKPQFSATSLDISNACERALPHQRNFYSRFPLLERFHYNEHLWSISPSLVSDLMQGLSGVTSTLLDFSLWMDNSDCKESRDVEKFSIGSLAKFEKLKTVKVMSWSLTGSALDPNTFLPPANFMMRALPQSLEYLTLVDVTEEEVPSIEALIRNKTTYTPHLKELNLYWSILKYPDNKTRSLSETLYKHPGFTREEACELWQDCIAKGVKMLVTSCAPPN